jgi:hypothetical protein
MGDSVRVSFDTNTLSPKRESEQEKLFCSRRE